MVVLFFKSMFHPVARVEICAFSFVKFGLCGDINAFVIFCHLMSRPVDMASMVTVFV